MHTGFYAGIFAGLDFGPLPQLTIQNNIINNYFGEGILAASFNGSYTSNSITGTGTFAINRNGNEVIHPLQLVIGLAVLMQELLHLRSMAMLFIHRFLQMEQITAAT
jgi:hypothetical protein